MKKQKFWNYAVLIFAALCMSVVFTSCELEDEESDEPKFSDYFKMEITGCERVGDVLILDWTIKNKSKNDVQSLCLDMDEVWCHSTDDTGETYPYGDVSVGGTGSTYSGQKTFSVLAGETVKGKIRINSFNSTNTAKKFTLNVDTRCTELGVEETLEFSNVKITDNRVMSKGIQTNDRNLTYTVKSCKRDSDGDVILAFTVANNTGAMLKNFYTEVNQMRDNFGSTCVSRISLTSDLTNEYYVQRINIEADGTMTYYLIIRNVNSGSSSISGYMLILSDNYEFETNYVNFYTIPIE